MLLKTKTQSVHSLLPVLSDPFGLENNKFAISSVIREKVSTYTNFRIKSKQSQLTLTRKKSKSKRQKFIPTIRQLPQFNTLQQLFEVDKQLCHVFKERLNSNFQEGLYVCMKLLKVAIDYQCQISKKKLDHKRTIIVETFIFVSETLIQLGYQRLAFYFGVIGVELGHIYRNCLAIGQGLIILSKIARKSTKFKDAIILLKKAIEYIWMSRNNQSNDLQIQAYSQLSYNFLQSNMSQECRIFGQKYETGFIESQDSKILNLSKQLITSLQKRQTVWQQLRPDTFTLVFKFNIHQILQQNQRLIRYNPIDQNLLLRKWNIEYDLFYESFMKHQMFFYEIPLPLEVKKSNASIPSRKISVSSSKFILKKRSTSIPVIKVIKQNQKVKQTIIFNYRGVGIATKKLMTMLIRLIALFKVNSKKIPVQTQNSNNES